MNDTSKTTGTPVIGGSWHGHSIPSTEPVLRLIQRDKVPPFPPPADVEPLIIEERVELYRLHTVSHGYRPATRWYSQAEDTYDALAELMGFGAATITDEMITAGLSLFPLPVTYRSLDPLVGVTATSDRTSAFDMIKTLWTVMQRARR